MIHLEKRFVEEMIAHARAESPREACGVLVGRGGRIERLYRTANVAENPKSTYRLDAAEQFRIFKEMDEQDWELIGIYHSHPASSAYPSPTDVDQAYFPESIYFIVSLADRNQPVIRAFRIVEGKISEVLVQS